MSHLSCISARREEQDDGAFAPSRFLKTKHNFKTLKYINFDN